MKNYQKTLRKKSNKINKSGDKLSGNKLIYLVIPFGILLIALIISDLVVRIRVDELGLRANPITNFRAADLPVLNSNNILNISSYGAIIIDNDSKSILFSKNPMLRFSMASTTKIMTALVALDHYKMNDILTVQTDNVEGSVVGFKKGERLTFESLLYAMLLPSANDAALAIAQNYPGGENAFVEKMNEKALNLHLYSTHFADPAGLADSQNYTTVLELAELASDAIKNPIIANIVSTKTRIISDVDGLNVYTLNNLNILLGTDGVDGIKTGYTDEAGEVLVTSANIKNHKVIIVVMKSEDRFADTLTLLSYLINNLSYSKMHL